MHDNISLVLAFILGLGSSFHCMVMCGGIISALSLSLPQHARKRPRRLFFLVLAYNSGRIASYALAGGLAGTLAYLSPLSTAGSAPYFLIQGLAALFLLLLGLQVAGWLPQLKKIEALGLWLWRYLQPLGRHFIPADTLPRAIMAGAIWGWLPCGLVYSVLLWTLSSTDPWKGASYMFMFGLGTVPSMLSTGMAGSTVMKFATRMQFRTVAGILIILLGLASPVLQLNIMEQPGNAARATPTLHSPH